MNKFIIIAFIILTLNSVFSQDKKVEELEEVILPSSKLTRYSVGFKITKFNDSILKSNHQSLSALLQNEVAIYFKSYGVAMLSSPSFRGTGASHTAVLWNGIPMNSTLNGQTDFNLINSVSIDEMTVRAGGGSILFGSGAIGGSIHLKNKIDFKGQQSHHFLSSYGSYATYKVNYRFKSSTKKMFTQIGFGRMSSENDYKYWDTDTYNNNGDFFNNNLNAVLGFKLSEAHVVSLYLDATQSERGLSNTITAPSASKQDDENFKLLLEWKYRKNSMTSMLKLAYLYDQFTYYAKRSSPNLFSVGDSKNSLLKYQLEYSLNTALRLLSGIDVSFNQGDGDSLEAVHRSSYSVYSLLNHRVSHRFHYDVSVRKEFSNTYKIPFLFGIDAAYKYGDFIYKMNASRNYRVPTFNDLYWAVLGNPTLKPESSYQGEIGIAFNKKGIEASANTFYIASKDLIKWSPNSTDDVLNGAGGGLGAWTPKNIYKAVNYGLELGLKIPFSILNVPFVSQANYSYTIAEDVAKKKQLLYVPKIKWNYKLSTQYQKFTGFYQVLYRGKSYTTSDNSYFVANYTLHNLGINYTLKGFKKVRPVIGLQVNNIYNKQYAVISYRPMPGTNYQLQIQIKI
ncbi:MAG: TonB-dependent receptor [Flavobacteriaceae bacterium]|nr:TonB-dependent receptor [Flavobacteriaceae bacterium]